jgi:hypothetical protein
MMQDARKWLLAGLLAAGLGGGAMLMSTAPSQTAEAAAPVGEGWRNHDGHWSYYHPGDKRWYYTDGTHWYYHNGLSWVLYPFDRLFGREFHQGSYRVPPHDKVVVPHHGVFH